MCSILVSVLFSEPKIPQSRKVHRLALNSPAVSVLFSEPKIPQSIECCDTADEPTGFSALQRAENSSIFRCSARQTLADRFQCSSASRKFLNTVTLGDKLSDVIQRFSALQRAENSSMMLTEAALVKRQSFSALQRAENSSM